MILAVASVWNSPACGEPRATLADGAVGTIEFRTYTPASQRFAAYIPLYPYCNFRHTGKGLATASMLMLLGGADEMTEPAPCEHLAAELRDRGVPVRVIVYPGA